MRLLAPAGSLESARAMLEAGADDIYLGARSPYLENYSFNGRATFSGSGRRVLPDYGELKDIVRLAHDRGAGVYYLANTPFLNDGPEGDGRQPGDEGQRKAGDGGRMGREFAACVAAGVEAGVDAVVVGDLGALEVVRDMHAGLPIVASSYFEAQNAPALELLADLGASQVILSYQITLPEIQELAPRSPLQLEVFGHGGCSFYVGSCNLFHEAGEGGPGGLDVGYPCRGVYRVRGGGRDLGRQRFLDGFKICSLCHLAELAAAPVHALKIVGRDLDPSFMAQVTRAYRAGLDVAAAGGDVRAERSRLVPAWWQKMWCQPGHRCRYH